MRLRLPNVPHLQLAKQLAPIPLRNPPKKAKKELKKDYQLSVCGVNGFTFISFVCA